MHASVTRLCQLLLGCLCLAAWPVAAQDITTGLVGQWRFTENTGTAAADTSGNGNGCTLQGGATWQAGPAGKGSALLLNGTTAYTSCTTGTSLDLGATFTLAAWVYMAGSGSYPGFIVRSAAYDVDLAAYALYTFAGTRQLSVVAGATARGTATLIVPLDTWAFVAAAVDASGVSFYLDGASDTAAATGTPVLTGTTLQLGGWIAGAGAGFLSGGLDEVHIFTRKLNASDIAALRQSTGEALRRKQILLY